MIEEKKYNFFDWWFYYLYCFFAKFKNSRDIAGLAAGVFIILASFFWWMELVDLIQYFFIFLFKRDLGINVFYVIIFFSILLMWYFKKRHRNIAEFNNYYKNPNENRNIAISLFAVAFLFLFQCTILVEFSQKFRNNFYKNQKTKFIKNDYSTYLKIKNRYEKDKKYLLVVKQNNGEKMKYDFSNYRFFSYVYFSDKKASKEIKDISIKLRYGRIYETDKDVNYEDLKKEDVIGYWDFNYSRMRDVKYYGNPDYK